MSGSGYKRVYVKHGAWHFVDKGGKWHRLCALTDGEPAMLRALAKLRDKPEARPGSMPWLVADWRREKLPEYAESTRYDYGLMLDHLEAAMLELQVAEVDSGHVLDLRDQWLDKPRTANKYQALLSLLMGHAILKRLRKTNPCSEITKLKEAKRKRYLSHAELLQILHGLLVDRRGYAVPSGPMMALLVLFMYLTGLRMVDARKLAWSQVGEHVITVQPAKTKNSTGVTLEVEITPDIADLLQRAKLTGTVKPLAGTVFHGLTGQPYSKDAIETAWQRARERQGVENATPHDIRRKSLSDAKRAGRTLQEIQEGAGHASVTTTEGYLSGFEVQRVNLGLTLPKVSNSRG